jgi:hypothetical protein
VLYFIISLQKIIVIKYINLTNCLHSVQISVTNKCVERHLQTGIVKNSMSQGRLFNCRHPVAHCFCFEVESVQTKCDSASGINEIVSFSFKILFIMFIIDR